MGDLDEKFKTVRAYLDDRAAYAKRCEVDLPDLDASRAALDAIEDEVERLREEVGFHKSIALGNGSLYTHVYAERDALRERLESWTGPRCADADCADHDGEHPYHQSARATAHEAGQIKMRAENQALRERLAEAEEYPPRGLLLMRLVQAGWLAPTEAATLRERLERARKALTRIRGAANNRWKVVDMTNTALAALSDPAPARCEARHTEGMVWRCSHPAGHEGRHEFRDEGYLYAAWGDPAPEPSQPAWLVECTTCDRPGTARAGEVFRCDCAPAPEPQGEPTFSADEIDLVRRRVAASTWEEAAQVLEGMSRDAQWWRERAVLEYAVMGLRARAKKEEG